MTITKQSDIAAASTAVLVATYNALTGKSIKKFSSRAAGESQVAMAILSSENKAGHAGVPKGSKPSGGAISEAAHKQRKNVAAKSSMTRLTDQVTKPRQVAAKKAAKGERDASTAIKASWSDKDVRAARSLKERIKCDGKDYRSVADAFRQLRLPMAKHVKFRMELKESRKANFDGHKFLISEASA